MESWRRLLLGGVVLAGLIAGGCDDQQPTVEVEAEEVEGEPVPTVGNTVPTVEQTPAVAVDSGVTGVTPDAGGEAADAGVEIDAGTVVDAGTPDVPDAGPWPTDAVKSYSADYGVGSPQSVGIDEGFNIWLLDGARIGVLRPGDSAPKWVSGIGQARAGFGLDTFATGSSVICGGEAGRAYVGYTAHELQKTVPELQRAYIAHPGEPYYSLERYNEYFKGDLDAVRVNTDGSIVLEEHIWRTIGESNANRQIGIHNTNDFHYEEDRSVRACERVTRGPYRGDLFITTNHGVTRIQGLTYNSHRHPGWYKYETLPDGTTGESLQCPDMRGLGIGANGDVLVANEQMVGALVPNANLADWDRETTFEGAVPWRFKFFNHVLNDQASDDYWRAFEQVKSGRYYLGSAEYGLWSMTNKTRSTGEWVKVTALPSNRITSLMATDDGALYIGTENAGLWRMEADGTTFAKVNLVPGVRVKQIVYEPTVTPTMLLVLTDAGLTVLRGP